MNRRELLDRLLNHEEVPRVPCGFWHHFILGADQFAGLERPDVLEKAYQGHLKYFNTVQPDIMKLMNEGFFGYPPIMGKRFEDKEDLLSIKALGPDHPWIERQVEHVKRLVDAFHDEVYCFYNIFSPLQMLRIRFDFLDLDYRRFVELAEKYPREMLEAGKEMQKDVMSLVKRLFHEAGIDGIYYCVQNIQSKLYDESMYAEIIKPSELPVLELANSISNSNILHICGYAGSVNNFAYYKDYKAKVFNWSVSTDKVSLDEGKKFFKAEAVLGGFPNTPDSLIDCGDKEELRDFALRLIKNNGFKDYIMGADCSVPNDIDDTRLRFIRDCCHEFAQEYFKG